jgi:hypothetical protein
VHDPGLGCHDELLGRTLGHRANHPLCRRNVEALGIDVAAAHAVDELPGATAFGVHQHFGLRIRSARFVQDLRANSLVDVALTHPHLDPPVGAHPPHVASEEEVGKKQDPLVRRDCVDHIEHVPAGAAVIELRLHLGRGVHVSHGDVIGELRPPLPDIFRRDGGRERTSGPQVGQQHSLLGR